MLPLDSSVRVFMVLGHTDMRKAINGLSVMVADHLDLNVFTGNLFVSVQATASYIPPHLCDDASPNQGGHHGKAPRVYVLG